MAAKKVPPRVTALTHDFAMSGVLLDGTFWRECRCGWRTPLCGDLRVAGDLFEDHIAASPSGVEETASR